MKLLKRAVPISSCRKRECKLPRCPRRVECSGRPHRAAHDLLRRKQQRGRTRRRGPLQESYRFFRSQSHDWGYVHKQWNRAAARPLTKVTLGSADNDTFSYDRNTGRLTQYNFNIGATPQTVQGNLTWNANGTLAKLAITDPFNSVDTQTCTFGYDDLARVKSANCGSAWSQTFSLDPFGNLSKSGTVTFQPGFDQTKNWFLPTTGFDNNGNLLKDATHTYNWDAENKLTAIDTVSLTFDALGRMVEQARGSSYTQIVYSPAGSKLALMSGQALQKAFCPLPGEPLRCTTPQA